MSNIYSNIYNNEEKKRPVSASAVVRIVIWSVVLCLLTGIFVLAMCNESGLNFGFVNLGGYFYDDDDFCVGNGTTRDTVTDISIDWVAGKVTLIETEGDEIVISEDYDGNKDACRLRWKVDDGELVVKYRESSWSADNGISKDLTVAIPSSMVNGLDEIHVTAVSAVQSISVSARELEIDTVSGTAAVKGTYRSVEMDTVSGNVSFEGIVKDFDISGVSARLDIRLYEQADSLDVDTVSGDLTLILPESTTGFRVNTDTLSGQTDIRDFDCGSSNKWGDGSMKINMDGLSAKLYIEKETKD